MVYIARQLSITYFNQKAILKNKEAYMWFFPRLTQNDR